MGNVRQNHYEKHKGMKLNLKEFAYTVDQDIKHCRSKGEVEDELKKCSKTPTLLEFRVADNIV